MEAVAARCDALLAATAAPLSFAIVVPGWRDSEAFASLGASRFRRGSVLVAKDDHGYVDGAQHQRRDRHRAAPYDTLVALLQNDGGAAKWPADAAKFQRLKRAFASGVPTTNEVSRRLKRGRGCAPEDGGGGVYKGKKKNKRDDSADRPRAKLATKATKATARAPAAPPATKAQGKCATKPPPPQQQPTKKKNNKNRKAAKTPGQSKDPSAWHQGLKVVSFD